MWINYTGRKIVKYGIKIKGWNVQELWRRQVRIFRIFGCTFAEVICLNAEYFCSRSRNSFNYAVCCTWIVCNTFCMFNRLEQFYYVLSSAPYFFYFCFYNSLPQVFLGIFEHTFNIRNNKSCSTTPRNTEEVYYIKQFQQGT